MAAISEKQVEQYAKLIAERIETIQGDWKQPWIDPHIGRAQNIDGRIYSTNGLNSMMLQLHALANHYEYPVYTTFVRAQQEGIQIKAGEKGILVNYYNFIVKDKETGEKIKLEEYESMSQEEKEKYSISSFNKIVPVFNLDQTNIREKNPELWEKIHTRMTSLENNRERDPSFSEAKLDNILEENRWIIPIRHSMIDTQAYYSPGQQIINLPEKKLFINNESYYGTALHEMAHSTEVPLKRDTNNYGREELVAELTSSIVASQYSLPKTLQEQNVQYLKGWLKIIRETPIYLQNILDDVHKASNFISKEIEDKYLLAENLEEDIKGTITYLSSNGQEETVSYTSEIDFLKALNEGYNDRGTGSIKYELIDPSEEFHNEVQRIYSNHLGLYPEDSRNSKQGEDRTSTKKELSLDPGDKNILFSMYANPNLMSSEFLGNNLKISYPELSSLLDVRRDFIDRLGIYRDPDLIKEKEILEDNIRGGIQAIVGNEFPLLPTQEQKEKLIIAYISKKSNETIDLDSRLLVNLSTYRDIKIKVSEPYSDSRAERLSKDGVDFSVSEGTITYDARTRYKEGFTLEDTPENRLLLSDKFITSTPLANGKLFISNTEAWNMDDSPLPKGLESIYGMGLLPKLLESNLVERIDKNDFLSEEDKKNLLNGETIIKGHSFDYGSDYKLYYIDKELNQLRSASPYEPSLPRSISNIPLDKEQELLLRETNSVVLIDKENLIYYKARLSMQKEDNISVEYRTSLSESYRPVPTVESPDEEKKKYIAVKGAEAINEIWGREGVKLERDSFLDRYNVAQSYREYLQLKSEGQPGNTIKQNNLIKRALSDDHEYKNALSR